jgi:hypothetical protein
MSTIFFRFRNVVQAAPGTTSLPKEEVMNLSDQDRAARYAELATPALTIFQRERIALENDMFAAVAADVSLPTYLRDACAAVPATYAAREAAFDAERSWLESNGFDGSPQTLPWPPEYDGLNRRCVEASLEYTQVRELASSALRERFSPPPHPYFERWNIQLREAVQRRNAAWDDADRQTGGGRNCYKGLYALPKTK